MGNNFNDISIKGKELAGREILSILGKCCIEDAVIDAKDRKITLEDAMKDIEVGLTFDPYNPADFYCILQDCLSVIGHLYCDSEYNDEKLDNDLRCIEEKFNRKIKRIRRE